jgi:hypothetical protein
MKQRTYKNKNTKTSFKNKTLKNKTKKSNTFTKEDYSSNQGMITNIWGPPFWLILHTISFNYPTYPSLKDKKHYMDFIYNLQFILPCKYCRMNLIKYFKKYPLTMKVMENRETFSKYIYELHETVNNLLGKTSGLTYEEVRDRFENFRSRCTNEEPKIIKDHKGCVVPLYGKKAKCILKIVPHDEKCETFEIDEKCLKKYKIQDQEG